MNSRILRYCLPLVAILSILSSCKDADAPDEGQESVGLDNTNLVFQQPEPFSIIDAGTTFTWSAAEEDDYVYALKIAFLDPRGEDYYTPLQMESEITVAGIETNQFVLSQELAANLEFNNYYLIAVIKYPRDTNFNEFIEQVPEEELFNYLDVSFAATEGKLPQGEGCELDDCTVDECPNGAVTEYVCENEFSFCTLCATLSEMVLLDFNTEDSSTL